MAFEQIPVLELVWKLVTKQTENISRVHYKPQKPFFNESHKVAQPFPRKAPEGVGVSSEGLLHMLHKLSDTKETDMHQLLMVKDGAVILECGFAPYQRGMWHATYSLCKSITGMAIGMLIDEDKLTLDTKVVDIFDKQQNLMSRLRQRELTVEHLLTMTSGVACNETAIVSGNQWAKSFLESSMHFDPGERFEYNSMNSYILSAIVTEITGQSMFDYLKERLWEPLGISDVFWESCPEGITKGGWGLYLRPEDAAKLGQLYLQHGQWKDVQIISKDWVEQATSRKVEVPDEMGFGGYGYQLWGGSATNSFVFNGMLGQNVLVYPDKQLIIVTNAGNSQFFQRCEMLDIICNHIDSDQFVSTKKPSSGYKKLQKEVESIESTSVKASLLKDGYKKWTSNRRDLYRTKQFLDRFNEKLYTIDEAYVGILPIFSQVIHNNFSQGLERLQIYKRHDMYYLLAEEGVNTHKILLGIDQWRIQDIDLKGEPYTIANRVSANYNEDHQLVFKIDIAFLEDATRRRIKITLKDETQLEIKFYETPGKDIIMEGMDSLLVDTMNSDHLLIKGVRDKGIFDLLFVLFNHTIEPVVTAHLEEK